MIRRIRNLARWARYVRFAGPLARLALKLHDQLWVFTKTWRAQTAAHVRRALAHRSMVFRDLQRIESVVRLQTTLASLPSQFFVHHTNNNSSSTNEGGSSRSSTSALLRAKKQQGDRLKRQLAWLKFKLLHPSLSLSQRKSFRVPSHLSGSKSATITNTNNMSTTKLTELYDRVVDLAQEVKTQVESAVWNNHLISPQTRFSVAWRLVVTCTLLSECNRLYWSWKLSDTFDMRYTDMTKRFLGLCQSSSRPVRRWIGKVLHLPYNHPWLDTCRQSSPSSQMALYLARGSEIGIDLVGFLDIFVWFYTGELDETGLVVPKPFFYRCILPGTLTQVLDHPTFPQALPMLIRKAWMAAGALGYGRVIRWCLALWPALDMLVVTPLYGYLFRPMDDQEYMTYSESLGLMRTFSSSISPSYPSTVAMTSPPSSPRPFRPLAIPSPQPFKSLPSRTDLLENSMRSATDENEGYGLFY